VDDVPAVARLLGEFHDHLGKPRPSPDELRGSVRRVMDGGDGEFLIAFAGDGEPAGFAQLRWRWAVWTRAFDAWLEDLFVSERYRRSGLGKELVAAVIERARERGCVRLELDVDEDNDAGRALYRRAGFSERSKGSARSLLLGLRTGAGEAGGSGAPRR
jgi:ribosomal protein S18 acetylase RimI-like enzyme